jgi:hypothetical protein
MDFMFLQILIKPWFCASWIQISFNGAFTISFPLKWLLLTILLQPPPRLLPSPDDDRNGDTSININTGHVGCKDAVEFLNQCYAWMFCPKDIICIH